MGRTDFLYDIEIVKKNEQRKLFSRTLDILNIFNDMQKLWELDEEWFNEWVNNILTYVKSEIERIHNLK